MPHPIVRVHISRQTRAGPGFEKSFARSRAPATGLDQERLSEATAAGTMTAAATTDRALGNRLNITNLHTRLST